MTTPLTTSDAFRVGTVSYNNFEFPPAKQCTASFQPVYDDSGRTVMYLQMELSINFYLFKGFAGGNPPGIGDLTYTPPTSVGDEENTVDGDFVIVRQRLSEPSQTLNFTLQGIGSFHVQDGSIWDVDNGPKPQVVAWRPITNKACYVEWKVTTTFANCITTPGNFGYTQFPFSVSDRVNEAGVTVRTYSGSLGIPVNRQPNAGSPRAGDPAPFDTKAMKRFVDEAFQKPSRFHRTYEFNLSDDRKTMTFTVTDTEIPSDEPYGVGCVREDVTLSARNSIDKVFMKWDVSLAGTIEVAAGYPKAHAFDEISRLFTKFYKDNGVKGFLFRGGTTNKSEATQPAEVKQSYPLLRSISFSDQIFGRSVSFEFRWWLFCNISYLFQATGMFLPVRSSFSEELQAWNQWSTSLGLVRNFGSGYSNLNFTNTDDIIVNLCDGIRSQPVKPDSQTQPRQSQRTRPNAHVDNTEIKPENSYVTYQPRFRVEVQNHNTPQYSLEALPSSPEKLLPDRPSLREMMLPIDELPTGTNPTGQTPVRFHKRRTASHILHFEGMAIRVNYPVPIPGVASYGGKPVHPIGTADIRPQKLGLGVDPATGKSHQLFGLLWRKSYALTLPPGSAIINSDGHADMYV